jgi:hypothetical protein
MDETFENMRLSLSVNGTSRYIASLPRPGYLNAHLNMRDRPKEDDRSADVHIVGTDTAETETVGLEWAEIELKVGDIVQLEILPEGEGDPPSEVRRSSESPYNLLTSAKLAKEVLDIVSKFDTRLMKLLSKSEKIEPPDEYKKFRRAVGGILWELAVHLLYPVYRRHKELIPDQMKGEIL